MDESCVLKGSRGWGIWLPHFYLYRISQRAIVRVDESRVLTPQKMGVWILALLLTGSKAFNKIFYSEDSCGESWMSLKISHGFAYMESRQNLTYCSPTMQEILSGMQSKCTLEPVFQNFTVELGEQATHESSNFILPYTINLRLLMYGLYSPALHTCSIHTIS